MDLRHQSSAMCIIMLGGEDTHPWSHNYNEHVSNITQKKLRNRSCNQRVQWIEDISIQKLNEAGEKVTIMKQRTHKFLD